MSRFLNPLRQSLVSQIALDGISNRTGVIRSLQKTRKKMPKGPFDNRYPFGVSPAATNRSQLKMASLASPCRSIISRSRLRASTWICLTRSRVRLISRPTSFRVPGSCPRNPKRRTMNSRCFSVNYSSHEPMLSFMLESCNSSAGSNACSSAIASLRPLVVQRICKASPICRNHTRLSAQFPACKRWCSDAHGRLFQDQCGALQGQAL